MSRTTIIKAALRFTLGVCFILSGVMKAVNVYSFAQEIKLNIEAYLDSFFVQWTVEIAVAICAIETISGLLVLRKKYVQIVSIIFIGLMSFFVWLTGINLFFPSLMGNIESCGCFGELIHFSPLGSFVKSIILWMMAMGLFGLCVRAGWRMPLKDMLMDCKTYVIIAIGVLPAVYSYFCFEHMEHGWYLTGYLMLCAFVVIISGICYVNRK